MDNEFQVRLSDGVIVKGYVTDIQAMALFSLLMGGNATANLESGNWGAFSELQSQIEGMAEEKKNEVAEGLELKLTQGDATTVDALNELLCEEFNIPLPETGEEGYKEKFEQAVAQLATVNKKDLQKAKEKVKPRLIKVLAENAVFVGWIATLIGGAFVNPHKRLQLASQLHNVYPTIPSNKCSYSLNDGTSVIALPSADLRELLLSAISRGFATIKEQ